MRRRPPVLRGVAVWAVSVLGLAAAVAVVLASDPAWVRDDVVVLGALAALVVVAELRPITIPRADHRDEITVSPTFVLALALMGPLALAVVVQALAVAAEDVRRGRARKVLFDVGQHALTLCAARGTFALLTDAPFVHGGPLELPDQLPAALAAGLAYFVVAIGLSGVVTALTVHVPVHRQLLEDARSKVATSGVLLSFAPVAASSVRETLWLLPLLLLPIAAIHKSAQLAAEREREALHDTLTGLPNRNLLRVRMTRAIEGLDRSDGGRIGVMLVDLDHFKEINDTLGHQVGDGLIVEVAKRISANLRPGDTVARLGGDEFAILTLDLSSAYDGMCVAERLLEALEDPFTADGVRLDVQASLGLAVVPDHGVDVDTLLSRADIALYQAKAERGTVRVYEPTSDDHTPERLALAAELRHGLQVGELFLEFQPKVLALTGRTVGMEALVRWQHPRHGVLMPDDFLPLVEGSGLIAPLTMTVLDQALAAVAGWRAAGHDVGVAVNLSVRHLTDVDLPRKVDALLRGRGVPAGALTLEVTETVIMSDPSRAVAVLGLLRDLGVGVAIDDFGTGYSSLAYLRRLQIDELKIDKSFVVNLADDEGDAVIVRSTIEMGHNLGLRVVAEGVEDDATVRLLRGWKCDVLQGYGVSRPLRDADVLPWLDERAASLVMFGDRWVAAALASAVGGGLSEVLTEPEATAS